MAPEDRVADDARPVGASTSRWPAASPSRCSRSRIATPTAYPCACTARRPTRRSRSFVVLHGGGWVIGSVEEYDRTARQLANASGAIVVSVEYRLGARAPVPGAARRLLARAPVDGRARGRARWRRVAARDRRRQRGRQPRRGVRAARPRRGRSRRSRSRCSCTPCATADFGTASYAANGVGLMLEAEQMQWFFDCYTAGGTIDRTDWQISPLRATDLARRRARVGHHGRVRPAAGRGRGVRRPAARRGRRRGGSAGTTA